MPHRSCWLPPARQGSYRHPRCRRSRSRRTEVAGKAAPRTEPGAQRTASSAARGHGALSHPPCAHQLRGLPQQQLGRAFLAFRIADAPLRVPLPRPRHRFGPPRAAAVGAAHPEHDAAQTMHMTPRCAHLAAPASDCQKLQRLVGRMKPPRPRPTLSRPLHRQVVPLRPRRRMIGQPARRHRQLAERHRRGRRLYPSEC